MRIKLIVFGLGNEGLTQSDGEMRNSFHERAKCNFDVANEFFVSRSAATLSDICRNGNGGASYLRPQAIELVRRKSTCQRVNSGAQFNRFLPHVESLKSEHRKVS